ncbi:major facilitator superfamily transporter [Trichoderma cornu-damae]|uniref:Major facilitator superfamily transporter n=1 Tax=Trichoderma cornu-damae TaxID=654480 RepID=A0A9P8QSF4_9HYPO|nr:major facilitator superfamily transporter [Trichoderma cornu-damae]
MSEKDNKLLAQDAVVVVTETDDELSQNIDVEKLGRQRPEAFSSTWMEIAFVISILGSLSMADFVISGFQVVLPNLIEPLNIPLEAQTWPSSVLTLAAGAFLFPLGRLADMYGGYLLFNGGVVWFAAWSVIGGFTRNFIMLVVCRAMLGIGAAAFLPAGISLLGRIYRPGPRKNIVFSLYGAIAPLGFFSGIIIGGLAQDLLSWRWFFWLGGILSAVFALGTILTAPRDYQEARKMNVKMDWWGVFTTVPGLVLLIYALTDSANAPHGWASPQILATLILGLVFLGAAVYVEGWVAEAPLIPADIFRVKCMKRMLLCLFITWGVFNIYLFYANFYIETILKKPPLLTAVYFAPWAAGGLILATTSGLILHLLSNKVLIIASGISKIIAVLMFAIMPDNPNYWAWIFPAMLCEAACVDVLWTVSNVFLTTSLPKNRQGLAGALISVMLFLGGAFFLAIADVAREQFALKGMDLKHQYKNVFWIGVGLAGSALIVCFFMDLDKAGSALTVDEKAARKTGNAPSETESDADSCVDGTRVEPMLGVVVDSAERTRNDEHDSKDSA